MDARRMRNAKDTIGQAGQRRKTPHAIARDRLRGGLHMFRLTTSDAFRRLISILSKMDNPVLLDKYCFVKYVKQLQDKKMHAPQG